MNRLWIALAVGMSAAGSAHAAPDNVEGGTHVPAEAAMPPNGLASDADIKEPVDWILTLKA